MRRAAAARILLSLAIVVRRRRQYAHCRPRWLAGGGSGHGFKLSPALGEHVAQCVLGSAKPEPMFSIARLAKLNGQSTQFGDKE
jgi:hypothetical protein